MDDKTTQGRAPCLSRTAVAVLLRFAVVLLAVVVMADAWRADRAGDEVLGTILASCAAMAVVAVFLVGRVDAANRERRTRRERHAGRPQFLP